MPPAAARLLLFTQSLPLTLFVVSAWAHDFSNDGWALAFQIGAVTGAVQLVALLPILRNQLSRLLTGANLFLIFGGVTVYTNSFYLLGWLDELRAAGVIVFVGIVCSLATVYSPTGVFEDSTGKPLPRKYSYYFLMAVLVALAWSAHFRVDPVLGGAIPWLFLALVKPLLHRWALAAAGE